MRKVKKQMEKGIHKKTVPTCRLQSIYKQKMIYAKIFSELKSQAKKSDHDFKFFSIFSKYFDSLSHHLLCVWQNMSKRMTHLCPYIFRHWEQTHTRPVVLWNTHQCLRYSWDKGWHRQIKYCTLIMKQSRSSLWPKMALKFLRVELNHYIHIDQ